MRIAIIYSNQHEAMIGTLKNKIESTGLSVSVRDIKQVQDADFVFILGGDKGILHYFHTIDNNSP
ncbi:MAG: hypothetical protein QW050_02000, partial [Candidatus Nitrosocaldaceae archaeon]